MCRVWLIEVCGMVRDNDFRSPTARLDADGEPPPPLKRSDQPPNKWHASPDGVKVIHAPLCIFP
jgi:hypothetical protein